MNNDTLIIGGQEFHSRFILGSGKYSLNLIESAVRDAGAQIITLAVRRANTKEPAEQGRRRKPYVSPAWPENLAAAISSK